MRDDGKLMRLSDEVHYERGLRRSAQDQNMVLKQMLRRAIERLYQLGELQLVQQLDPTGSIRAVAELE